MFKHLFDKKNRIYGEWFFFAALIARLIISTWDSTMFPSIGIVRKLALLVTLGGALITIVFYNTYTLSEIICMVAVGGCMAMHTLKTGSNVLFVLTLLVIASKGIDFKKIIKTYLIVVGSIVSFAILCSLIGAVVNLKYYMADEGYFRNSFGIIYCTDFAAHVFFLTLAYFYLRADKLKLFEYVGAFLLTVLVYVTAKGKLDTTCMVITVVLFAIGNVINKDFSLSKVLKYRWNAIWQSFAPMFIVASSSMMVLLTILYDANKAWMFELDDFITNRLSIGNKTFTENGFRLFGQRIKLEGNGGSIITPTGDEYNFLDCSYMYILVAWGAVTLLVIILLYVYAGYKNKKDMYLLYAIAIVSLNCMIAHHMTDIAYNPFTFMIMAAVVPVAKERTLYVGEKVQRCINF